MQKVEGSSPFIRLGEEPNHAVLAFGPCPTCAPNLGATASRLSLCVFIARRRIDRDATRDFAACRCSGPDTCRVFVRREDAERFIEGVRGDDPEVAEKLRSDERELEGLSSVN